MLKSILFKSVLLITALSILSACSNDDDTVTPAVTTLETKIYVNLHAPQTGVQGQPAGGPFTKFSFSENAIVTSNNWDIAFRGTTIIVNGGGLIGISDEPARTGNGAVSIVSNTLNAVTAIPSVSSFVQDGPAVYAIPTGSGNGWFSYNAIANLITPIAGKIFVVKTNNGKYAKMEIISYYKDAPANPVSTGETRYYTFRYVYQPNGTTF